MFTVSWWSSLSCIISQYHEMGPGPYSLVSDRGVVEASQLNASELFILLEPFQSAAGNR